MATLQSVSKRAGVSTATVSKVLSNTPYVSEETRRKVLEAVEELGYVPNLAARALSSGKTHIIAVVFPLVYDPIFNDPLVLHMLEGVQYECNLQGYNLLLSTPRLDTRDETYQRLIQSRYMDGIVALDNVPTASVLNDAREKGIPSVAIGYHPHDYYVRSDDHGGGMQQMEHILQAGHRHIGIISAPTHVNFSIPRRLEGLRTATAQAGLSYERIPVVEGDFSIQSGADAAHQLLTEHPAITALICLNDRMAMGAIQQARLMGRSVPQDLAVVGYDDIPQAGLFTPGLTTINQQAPELGRIATRMLFDLLEDRQPTPVEVPTRLVVRNSSVNSLA